jgi:protease-4
MPRRAKGGASAPAQVARLATNAGGWLRDAVTWPLARRVPRDWIALSLERGIAEAPAALPAFLLRTRAPLPLLAVDEGLARVARDPRVCGVVVRVGDAPLGFVRAAALARAFARLRAAGKRVVVWAASTGNAGAWLGGVADRFWLAPEGRLELIGLRAETVFVRRALGHLRVKPDVFATGPYKSAGEMLERDSLSEPAREALEGVVDDLYATLVEGLAGGRAGSAERARAWIDGGPYLAVDAQAAGIVDGLAYGDELPAKLAALEDEGAGAAAPATTPDAEPREARLLSLATYLRVARTRFVWTPVRAGRAEIAVVPVLGAIRARSGEPTGVVGVLRGLAERANVRAVVVRVDSPGGEVMASDLLWRAVRLLAEKKPVIASLGDTAASGGYYLAMAAREIVADPCSLTGSIGVVMARFELDELLDWLGVSLDGVQRGARAGIRHLGPHGPDERAHLRRQVEKIYASFIAKTAQCRGRSESEIEAVARGRVWTGRRAHEIGLVDALGGLDDAIALARSRAGLASGEGVARYYTLAAKPWERLLARRPTATRAERIQAPEPELSCPIRIPLR